MREIKYCGGDETCILIYFNIQHNAITVRAVMYLLFPLGTQDICENSPSDAIHNTVGIALTSRKLRISYFYVIFSVECRKI
jgi:hypothetical protein